MVELMPGSQKARIVECQYLRWRLRLRDNEVWYADGRGNKPNPGRHSLNTRDYEEARETLKTVDLAEAIRLGIATPDNGLLSTPF